MLPTLDIIMIDMLRYSKSIDIIWCYQGVIRRRHPCLSLLHLPYYHVKSRAWKLIKTLLQELNIFPLCRKTVSHEPARQFLLVKTDLVSAGRDEGRRELRIEAARQFLSFRTHAPERKKSRRGQRPNSRQTLFPLLFTLSDVWDRSMGEREG